MSYTILGKKVLNEYIALGVYGAVGAATYLAMSGGDKTKKETTAPVLNSSSDEEAAFLQNFINDLEHADKAQAKH
ncbi:hypothetical protein BCR35DRAFT_310435 [Leucosporidium creatinivorum]|uniref:Uncharacterized protein n=1 Tax=Leucosporidium creatinivorum TaxID=106004 RepID=A0A1Y2D4L5_9BASI|nr:hypothetical protein BCR35DRAFT_310435 [Leucosporidium creatinivorum]